MLNNLETAKARRKELIQQICDASDEISVIDRRLPILKSIELEADLLQAEEHFVRATP